MNHIEQRWLALLEARKGELDSESFAGISLQCARQAVREDVEAAIKLREGGQMSNTMAHHTYHEGGGNLCTHCGHPVSHANHDKPLPAPSAARNCPAWCSRDVGHDGDHECYEDGVDCQDDCPTHGAKSQPAPEPLSAREPQICAACHYIICRCKKPPSMAHTINTLLEASGRKPFSESELATAVPLLSEAATLAQKKDEYADCPFCADMKTIEETCAAQRQECDNLRSISNRLIDDKRQLEDDVAAQRERIAELEGELGMMNNAMNELREEKKFQQSRAEQAESTCQALRRALQEYGDHIGNCNGPQMACVCGFERALASGAQTTEGK